ncbi:MAG: YcdB/YcdC domain-containing protein, partial [Bacillota bacterium]
MKKVQGVAAAVLAAGMLLASPVWAAENPASVVQATDGGGGVRVVAPQGITEAQKPALTEAQQQALEKVYQAVPELKELSVQHVNNEGDKTWSVMLSDRAPGTERGIQSANAYLTFETATGELISYNFQNPAWASEKVPSPTLAREKATAFARQILGDKIKDYAPGDDLGFSGTGTQDDKGNKITWVSADVPYYCLVNGIPLLNSGFRLGVDVFGHITSFHREKDEGIDLTRFPDPSRAVTREEAEKTFAGMLEMKLQYSERQHLYAPGFEPEKGETRPALVYVPISMATIDALTGKPLAEFMPSFPQPQRLTLQGEGQQLIARTPEEAAKLLADAFGIDMTGMQFQGASDLQSFPDRGIKQKSYTWNTIPPKGTEGKPDYDYRQMRFVHLTTIAGTGQVISYNYQDESGRGQKGSVSREAAQDTAVKFLQKYLQTGPAELEMRVYPDAEERIPAWVDQSKLKDQERPRPVISFTFNQVHQGVPVMDRACSVQVDALTGKIVGFYCGISGSPVPLPDNHNVVPAETAKAEFLKQHPLKLFYIWPEYFDQKAPSPWLVYIPDPGFSWGGYID